MEKEEMLDYLETIGNKDAQEAILGFYLTINIAKEAFGYCMTESVMCKAIEAGTVLAQQIMRS